jgi:glutaconate CoA-transferase subunit B
MQFLKEKKGFELESVHPGVTVEEVVKNTGFEFGIPSNIPETDAPTAEQLSILRSSVKEKISVAYPGFVENGGFGE